MDWISAHVARQDFSRKVTYVLVILFALAGLPGHVRAAGYRPLLAVKPVISCEQLLRINIALPGGTRVAINSATLLTTEKGVYCSVAATIAPSYTFQGNLPLEHWTQRFLMGTAGQQAGSCIPALNGEFAVAGGGGMGPGRGVTSRATPLRSIWGVDPQARIDTAYENTHMAAAGFKALIKAFYGQAPRFSYMMGCSAPGLQVLMEAQRFPEDFDGYSIGAPPLYQTNHDLGFFHGWEYHANQGPDGAAVLSSEQLPILHKAALEHCAAVSGVLDGDLQQPSACVFQRSWVQCAAGAADTSSCLTAEQALVAEQLYLGPNDGAGHFFEVSGWPLGSELEWRLSTTGKPADREGESPHGLHTFLMPPLSGQDTATIMRDFRFNLEWFTKTTEMQPLFNAANTDLRRLAKLGGKIILWQGAEDTTVQPDNSLSYFEGVEKEMSIRQTDAFMRYFLLPGVGHCGGGDGASQVDTLSPLMAWVELHRAPAVLIAGKPVQAANDTGGPPPQAQPGGSPGGGGGGGPNGSRNSAPYPQPARPVLYTRPVYPYPLVAVYRGKDDPKDAASYGPHRGPAKIPQLFRNETARLLGPDNQKFYRVADGQLVVVPKP